METDLQIIRRIAQAAVERILDDLRCRAGLQNAFEQCASDIQEEIRAQWQAIVAKEIEGLPLEKEPMGF